VNERGEPAVRAFVALDLDARVREAIRELQARLAPRLAGIRLTRPEGIHLTLRFLGPTAPTRLSQLGPALGSAAASAAPGVAPVRRLGTFPEQGSPRVLWLGIELPPQVLELQRACERAAQRAGFEPEERPFHPHLTLGRWRDRAQRPDLPETDLGATRLETLVLYRSEPRVGGAVYTALERFELGGG
jgi:2'-5' RNA ligase